MPKNANRQPRSKAKSFSVHATLSIPVLVEIKANSSQEARNKAKEILEGYDIDSYPSEVNVSENVSIEIDHVEE